jgi:hypothetical protein
MSASSTHRTKQATQERYTHTLPGELEQAREQFDRWLAATDAGDERLARPHEH